MAKRPTRRRTHRPAFIAKSMLAVMALAGLALLCWPFGKSNDTAFDSALDGRSQITLASIHRDRPALPPSLSIDDSHAGRTRPIEILKVGERVLARNPEVTDEERATWEEPDWNQWLHLSLVMPKPDGSELKIELLRSEQWVLENWSPLFEPIDPMDSESPRPASGRGVGGEGPQDDSPLPSPGSSLQPAPLTPLRPIFQELVLASALAEATDHEFLGATVHMDLHELAIEGPAFITDVRSCPAIESGPGQVITATFHHSSGDVIDLVIGDDATNSPSERVASNANVEGLSVNLPSRAVGGSDVSAAGEGSFPDQSISPRPVSGRGVAGEGHSAAESIGTTSNHPFWSVDRQEYVQAGYLEIGERLLTYHGDTKRVVNKLARPGPEAVFNLEVMGEHVYYVGVGATLVHNSSEYVDRLGSHRIVLDENIGSKSLVEALRREGFDAHRSIDLYGKGALDPDIADRLIEDGAFLLTNNFKRARRNVKDFGLTPEVKLLGVSDRMKRPENQNALLYMILNFDSITKINPERLKPGTQVSLSGIFAKQGL